jgi:predicted RNA-binding protein with PUA-like domain
VSTQRYWLFLSEPNVYSIDDLQKEKDGTTYWGGIRNYQARNFLRDDVRVGDGVLFYHGNTEPAGIVGIAVVTRAAYPDSTQFESGHAKFDAGSTQSVPRWFTVDIAFRQCFDEPISLPQLRARPGLEGMALHEQGSRLSIQPVTKAEWQIVMEMAGVPV